MGEMITPCFICAFFCRSDASVDALVSSPCSDVVADNDAETKAVDSDMQVSDLCSHDESMSRNLVKYGELIILG